MEFEFTIDPVAMRQLNGSTPRMLNRFLARAGMAWEADAVKAISQGGRFQAEATGNLKNGISSRVSGMRAIVSANARNRNGQLYAHWVHDGTGVYGPRMRPIVPTRKKALSFVLGSGKAVVVRYVRGMRPRPFFAGTIEGVIRRLPDVFRAATEETIVKPRLN